jgi:hypothetical protein
MIEMQEHGADIELEGIFYQLTHAVEWHIWKHYAACGRDVQPTQKRTWDN